MVKYHSWKVLENFLRKYFYRGLLIAMWRSRKQPPSPDNEFLFSHSAVVLEWRWFYSTGFNPEETVNSCAQIFFASLRSENKRVDKFKKFTERCLCGERRLVTPLRPDLFTTCIFLSHFFLLFFSLSPLSLSPSLSSFPPLPSFFFLSSFLFNSSFY